MHTGYITYLRAKKKYGFIDSPELEMENIFFHFTNCKKSYQNFFKGDKVQFEIDNVSQKGTEAKNVAFIRNASLEGIRRDYENGSILRGFLKIIDGCYYVKDRETHILIKLVISSHEINLKEVYEDYLNKLIDYKIVLFSSKNRIRAINVKRNLLSVFENVKLGLKLQGVVRALVKGGYKIEIGEGLDGFMPMSLVERSGKTLQITDSIEVTIINIDDHLTNVILDLTESLENDQLLSGERQRQLELARPGDKFQATIKSVVSYGLFVRCEYFEGLLHVNHLVPSNFDFSKKNKKEFTKLLKSFFKVGQAIVVVCEENVNGLVGFKIDLTQSENVVLLTRFNKVMQEGYTDNDGVVYSFNL
jgi:cold shock CspA family protein